MYDISEMALICREYLNAPDSALALVTLVEKEGTSYRQPGARMLIRQDGSVEGTISGGCLEGDFAELARRMAAEGRSETLELVDTRPVFGCHGTITLFVELIEPRRTVFHHWMTKLAEAIERRRPITLQTIYRGEKDTLGTTLGNSSDAGSIDSGCLIQLFGLRHRAVVIGAHGDVEPVLNLIRSLGWQAIQIVPGSQRRGWIADKDSGIRVEYYSPEEMIRAIPADSGTAVVVMTHNMGRDVGYAHVLLREDYPYVGMLGSSKRRNEVFEHLLASDEEDAMATMERLYCPIGLDIGSETQSEIALSIVSEMKSVLSGHQSGNLKNKKTSIHSAVEISRDSCFV